MKSPELRLDRRYRGPATVLTFGHGIGPFQEVAAEAKYYAFTATRGAAPRVFEYDNDPDGVEALSNLIRAEDLVALVHGTKVQFEQASVVALSIGKQRVEHRLKVG